MNSIHTHLAGIDLTTRRTAAEFQELYKDLKTLATDNDNRSGVDKSPRYGEVSLQETADSVQVGLGYTMDQGYTGERLSIVQTNLNDDGQRAHTVDLRAEPTDPKGRYLRFERWEYDGLELSKDSHKQTVLVDTQKGTLFVDTPSA